MKIYIAGKVTGLDRLEVLQKFTKASDELKKQGYHPFVPCVLPDYEDVPHEDYLHVCYAMIDICDAIYLLSDWQQSKGARMELQYAADWKKKILYQDSATIEQNYPMPIHPPTAQNYDGLTPVWQHDEKHGRSQIKIIIYQIQANNRYSYSIQCKLCTFIRAIFPHQLEKDFPTRLDAEKSAVQLLYSWTKGFRSAKEHLKSFDLLAVGQQELFPELLAPD